MLKRPDAGSSSPSNIAAERTSKLLVDSIPSGATVYLDGTAMPLDNGQLATTPSDIAFLKHGQTYEIRLVKKGYEPFSMKIGIDEDSDGKTLRPELKRIAVP